MLAIDVLNNTFIFAIYSFSKCVLVIQLLLCSYICRAGRSIAHQNERKVRTTQSNIPRNTWAVIAVLQTERVTENNRLVIDEIRVKMCGKSTR